MALKDDKHTCQCLDYREWGLCGWLLMQGRYTTKVEADGLLWLLCVVGCAKVGGELKGAVGCLSGPNRVGLGAGGAVGFHGGGGQGAGLGLGLSTPQLGYAAVGVVAQHCNC